MKRIASIDFGMKRIGMAISDPLQVIATPLETIAAMKHLNQTAAKVLSVLSVYDLEAIVVGMPYLMSGKVGLLADEVKAFIEILRQSTSIPIIPFDERLTSVQADRSLREANFSRKKRAQKVDSVAALILLQCYLDGKSLNKE